ncbi:MAG: hypothetical protein AUK35_05815 [Zetaproteobacteria bacterium CG2_30_46_52]|nr:MAG: hypothetical protein AUK35_05815 [Zetaproteobacteria bacterium CG2_30_46_52]
MTNEKDQEPVDDNTYAKEALFCEVGATLREVRESKGISKEKIIKALKFSPHFLDALESGNWADLPGEVYAVGFLRQYAQLLEINVEPQIQRIKSNTFELTAPITYPDAPISPNKTWVAVAVLMFVAVFIFMNLGDEDKPSQNTAASLTEQPLQEATTTVAEVMVTEMLPQEQDEAAIVVAQQSPTSDALVVNNPKRNKTMVVDVINSNFTASGEMKTYSFFAVHEDVWLQLFEQIDDEEPILLREALLKAGESFAVKTSEKLLLTSGNSMALEISSDQEVLFAPGSLGKQGKVLKKYLLP